MTSRSTDAGMLPAFLSGGGEMGARIRDHDWRASPLGDPHAWPPSLQTLVALMLASRQPMFIAWGGAQTWLYNDAFEPILGGKHPQALGRPALGEVWSEAREVLGPLFERVFAGEPVHMDDFGLELDRNGRLEEAHFAFSYTPVRGAGGEVSGLFGACIETTDRILASRREVATLLRQRRMYEQAPSFVCMLEGPEHVFDFVNKAHQDLFNSAAWVGKPVREAFSDIEGQGYYERLDDVYRTGKRFVAEAAPVAFRRTPDAPVVERLLSFIYEPVVDDKGAVTGIFCEGFDVTETHRAQQALRESEAQLQFLDRLGVAIRDCADAHAILALTNRMVGEHLGTDGCAFGDLERGMVSIRDDWTKGRSIAGAYPFAAFGEAVAVLGAGRALVVADASAELPPGDLLETFRQNGMQAVLCCPHAHAGRLVAVLAVYQAVPRTWSERDIALVAAVVERSWAHVERVRAQEKLLEADRRKDEFLATLAHELRNPLAPLRNALHLLRSGVDAARGKTLHGMMQRQVDQMVRLVDDLLDVARITQGKIALRLAPVEIAAVVASALESTAALFAEAGRDIATTLPAEALVVRGDAARLVQVLSNILHNAVKFSATGGRIRLAVAREGGDVVMRVSDDGIGIPRDKLEEVFGMFSQLERSLERTRSGLGLGLALARQIVEMHGGSIRANSDGAGLGSEFVIRLPLSVEATSGSA